jgi:hypothetical protein
MIVYKISGDTPSLDPDKVTGLVGLQTLETTRLMEGIMNSCLIWLQWSSPWGRGPGRPSDPGNHKTDGRDNVFLPDLAAVELTMG